MMLSNTQKIFKYSHGIILLWEEGIIIILPTRLGLTELKFCLKKIYYVKNLNLGLWALNLFHNIPLLLTSHVASVAHSPHQLSVPQFPENNTTLASF